MVAIEPAAANVTEQCAVVVRAAGDNSKWKAWSALHPCPDSAEVSLLCVILADETTALGEPKPRPEGRVAHRREPMQGLSQGQPPSLVGLVAAGAGIGIVFAIIGRIM